MPFVHSAAVLVAIAVAGACGPASNPPTADPAARIENPAEEARLATVHLSPEAAERIGVEVGRVERRGVDGRRTLGGELQLPPDRTVVVSAPLAGRVGPPRAGEIPRAGTRVATGREVLRLVALPPERDRLHAREDVAVAEANLRNVRAREQRARALLDEGLISIETYDNAEADLKSAEAALRAARAQLAMIETSGEPSDEELSPLSVEAPRAGVLRTVHVAPGQEVAAGAPLFELFDAETLWVRLPVYVGDLQSVDRKASASVGEPGGGPDTERVQVAPIAAPPSANPQAATVDLYYRLDNATGRFRPGQRVGVTVSLTSSGESLGVPWSAVVYDFNGGAWVYEALDATTFARRRIDVQRVVDGWAVLARGPREGVPVVVTGAAELFSTEFGTAGH